MMDFVTKVLGPLLSLAALIFAVKSFLVARSSTLYSDIDARYHDLLKLGIEHPKFVSPNLTRTYKESFEHEELIKYERYAFAAWNIVETICDRSEDTSLFETWGPVVSEENRLHRVWLNSEENQHKFKKDFWRFILGNELFPCPKCDEISGDSSCDRCRDLRVWLNQN